MSSDTRPASQLDADDPQRLDLSGRTLGDYRVLRKLGQGGMGQVYLAEQISLKRPVALKILRPEMAASPRALTRFKREAESVARITHANIVQVYAFGEAEGILFMALEYVEGRNLKEFVAKKGPPDLLASLSIMRQVASALQRAGELGIIHRDIKPENILLTKKGEIKVADFGLSRCLEEDQGGVDLTQTGQTMGTPLYMSPEQVEGKPLDTRTDIYSFGVTCYQMLTGQPPFHGATAFEVALQHVQKPPPPLGQIRPDLPEALCAMVHKMMEKDPARRYQTGRELLRDIIRIREGLSGVGTTNVQVTLSSEERAALSSSATGSGEVARSKVIEGASSVKGGVRIWWGVGLAGSLLVAVALGGSLAWLEQRSREQSSASKEVQPAEMATVETILLANKREQALRTLVDQSLSPAGGKPPDVTGLINCIELAVLYLDNDRLEEAEKLFLRLEAVQQLSSFQMLGQTGRGIVLALQSKAKESNLLLCQVFAPDPAFIGPPAKGKKAGPWMPRRLEQHLNPIRSFLDHPRGRHWLGMARWYNTRNGIPASQVPRYLLTRFPLEQELRK